LKTSNIRFQIYFKNPPRLSDRYKADYSALYPTEGKNIPLYIHTTTGKISSCCVPPRGKIFRFISHNWENYSVLCPTKAENILLYIPQLGKLFRVVSHQGGKYSALNPATGKIIPRCIPPRGKIFRFISHNWENFSALYPETGNKLFPLFFKFIQNQNAHRHK